LKVVVIISLEKDLTEEVILMCFLSLRKNDSHVKAWRCESIWLVTWGVTKHLVVWNHSLSHNKPLTLCWYTILGANTSVSKSPFLTEQWGEMVGNEEKL
jgi:hypothetical protein